MKRFWNANNTKNAHRWIILPEASVRTKKFCFYRLEKSQDDWCAENAFVYEIRRFFKWEDSPVVRQLFQKAGETYYQVEINALRFREDKEALAFMMRWM